MALALVQSNVNTGSGVSSITATLGGGTTSGNTLIALLVGWYSSSFGTQAFGTPGTPSGSWSKVYSSFQATSQWGVNIYHYINCSAGLTTFTVTVTSASFNEQWSLGIYEISGLSTSATLDTNFNVTTGSAQTLAVTATGANSGANALVVGVAESNGNNTFTSNSGTLWDTSVNTFSNSAWKLYGSALASGTPSVTFDCNNGSNITKIGMIAAFDVAGVDATATPGSIATTIALNNPTATGVQVGMVTPPSIAMTTAVLAPTAVDLSPGGGAPSFEAPIWQKPTYSTNPYQLDESKLPSNLVDVWLLNEGGGTLVRSLKRRAVGLLTGPWTGSRGGPAVNFESNPNTGNLNEVALANIQTTTETPEALRLVGGHEFTYEVLIRHETLSWGSGPGIGKSELIALDGTGTIHEDGIFNGAQDIGLITIETYTTVANPIVGAWRTYPNFGNELPNGRWVLVHAVWRYGGADGFGRGHIFFDGKEVSGYQLQESPFSDGTLDSRGLPLTIGSALDVTHTNIGDDPWPGMLAHLIIWNRGLTDAEVRRRVTDGYSFIRQKQPRHTWFFVPALPPHPERLVPQAMLITTATTRSVPQAMWLDHAKRSVPQGLKVGGIRRPVPQLMLMVVDTVRYVPQHLALSPFVRSVPQHMELSPANMRSITQQMRLGITLARSVTQHMLPDYGGTTQAPRSVPQTAVLKLKGSHKPPKTNNRDIPQFLLASPKPRGVPQFGAISKVGITRFVTQAMTISLSAGVRSVPQHGAIGSVGTIRSVLQSVVAKKLGAVRSVPQFALMNTVAGRFERSVPQATVLSVGALSRLVPQLVATDRTAPLARTVHQQVVVLEQLIRSVTQDATVAEVSVRSVPQHAKLKATNIRSVPQHMQAGGTTVSQRGIPVVSIGKIPVVVVPSEPEVELSIK